MKIDWVKISKSVAGVLNPWKGDLKKEKFGNLIYALVAIFSVAAPLLPQSCDSSHAAKPDVTAEAPVVNSESDSPDTLTVESYLDIIDAVETLEESHDVASPLDILNAESIMDDAIIETESARIFDECYHENCEVR